MSNIDKYIPFINSTKYTSTQEESEYELPQDSFVFAIQKSHHINIIQGDLNGFSENIFDILQENNNKEKFYIKAIKNLLKQKEYINLLYQVSNELISDEEFSNELTENEDKYLINIENSLDRTNFKVISGIIDNIGNNFTDDDVSEIFSLRTKNIENLLLNK